MSENILSPDPAPSPSGSDLEGSAQPADSMAGRSDPTVVPNVAPVSKKSPILLFIVLVILAVVSVLAIYLFLQVRTLTLEATATPTPLPTPVASPDPTANWQGEDIPALSLSFAYPAEIIPLDYPRGIEVKGETGTQLCLSFITPETGFTLIKSVSAGGGACTGIFAIGSTTANYTAGREGGFGDLHGFVKSSGKYFALNVLDKKFELRKDLVREVVNKNGINMLVVTGENTTNFTERGPEPIQGTPGEGYIGALVNTTSGDYPGFNIQMKLTDELTPELFDQILSTFKFTNMSTEGDSASWQTYTNPEHGYAIKYPPSMRLDTVHNDGNNRFTGIKGEGLNVAVMLRKNSGDIKFDSYYYMDNPINSKSTLGGKPANVYIQDVTNSGCITSESGPECPGSFVAYVAINGNDLYHLEFYGDTILNDTEKEILSSFKFID